MQNRQNTPVLNYADKNIILVVIGKHSNLVSELDMKGHQGLDVQPKILRVRGRVETEMEPKRDGKL